MHTLTSHVLELCDPTFWIMASFVVVDVPSSQLINSLIRFTQLGKNSDEPPCGGCTPYELRYRVVLSLFSYVNYVIIKHTTWPLHMPITFFPPEIIFS